MKIAVVILPALLLAGCIGPNSRLGIAQSQSLGLDIAARAARVELLVGPVPTGVKEAGEVVGASCKNKFWEPDPTESQAMERLKLAAAEKGATKVAGISVEKKGTDLIYNCWASIVATGTAIL